VGINFSELRSGSMLGGGQEQNFKLDGPPELKIPEARAPRARGYLAFAALRPILKRGGDLPLSPPRTPRRAH
jgi:hypothetical protein